MVAYGQQQNEYDEVSSLVSSPNGQRWAYAARAGEKRFMVIDGQEQTRYDEVGSLVFSPNEQRWAYAARAGTERYVVVDGQEQTRYDRIELPSLVFSPDSQRLAYDVQIAKEFEEDSWLRGFIVVDGEEGARYDRGIEEGSLVFSPNSRRVAYMATAGISHFFGFSWAKPWSLWMGIINGSTAWAVSCSAPTVGGWPMWPWSLNEEGGSSYGRFDGSCRATKAKWS